MNVRELKALLELNQQKQFLIQLPNNKDIPQSFHITEVGFVAKTFMDCGGKVHTVHTCQLQAWIGPDVDHRIEAAKMIKIFKQSEAILPNELLDIEIEYEDTVISQYPIEKVIVTDTAVTLHLTVKHTDCLAKELCLPQVKDDSSCCGGGGCC